MSHRLEREQWVPVLDDDARQIIAGGAAARRPHTARDPRARAILGAGSSGGGCTAYGSRDPSDAVLVLGALIALRMLGRRRGRA